MGRSIRSKRGRANRRLKRAEVYGPKEAEKLKQALAFEYNDQTEKSHLNPIFHDVMNGPPPKVPGLEPGSGLERAHLTLLHETDEKIQKLLQVRSNKKIASAVRALTRGVESYDSHPKEKLKLEKRKHKESEMDDRPEHVYNEFTERDQFGQYPVWMNSRIIRQKARKNRIAKKKLRKKILKKKKSIIKPEEGDNDSKPQTDNADKHPQNSDVDSHPESDDSDIEMLE